MTTRHFNGTSTRTTNIRMYIFLENRSIGLHFAADRQYRSIFVEICMVGSGIFVYFGERGASAVQGHPRSMNLVPIESAHATFY